MVPATSTPTSTSTNAKTYFWVRLVLASNSLWTSTTPTGVLRRPAVVLIEPLLRTTFASFFLFLLCFLLDFWLEFGFAIRLAKTTIQRFLTCGWFQSGRCVSTLAAPGPLRMRWGVFFRSGQLRNSQRRGRGRVNNAPAQDGFSCLFPQNTKRKFKRMPECGKNSNPEVGSTPSVGVEVRRGSERKKSERSKGKQIDTSKKEKNERKEIQIRK